MESNEFLSSLNLSDCAVAEMEQMLDNVVNKNETTVNDLTTVTPIATVCKQAQYDKSINASSDCHSSLTSVTMIAKPTALYQSLKSHLDSVIMMADSIEQIIVNDDSVSEEHSETNLLNELPAKTSWSGSFIEETPKCIAKSNKLTIDCSMNENINNTAFDYVAATYSESTDTAERANTKSVEPTEFAASDFTSVPLSVKNLYDTIRAECSDFGFVYAISSQLCMERVPIQCFLHIKLGLLLSLASIAENCEYGPIPIIALGNDSHMANYLMMRIGQLAERYLQSTDDIKQPSATAHAASHVWIEADPVLLANGGVFYVGDWTYMKPAREETIFKMIECTRVSLVNSDVNYPLETAIWAHWRCFKYNAKDRQMFEKFMKIFGIPMFVDEANHESLFDMTLSQASVMEYESPVDDLSISEHDMREYLKVISKRTVDSGSQATILLQKYFVATRMNRPDCLTAKSYIVLKQFTESFAKLCFRHEVLEEDAVSAIYVCEYFLQNIFGPSSIDAPPPTVFETAMTSLTALQDGVAKFRDWLIQYVKKYDEQE